MQVASGAAKPSAVILHDGSEELGRRRTQSVAGPVLVLRTGPGAADAQSLARAPARAPASTAARRMVEDPGCSLTVNGQVHPFSACWSVRPSLGHFVVYTSLERDNRGRAVLRMGLEAQPHGGWAAFGLSHTRSMEGGEVAVVATDDRVPSGATISKFTLFAPLAQRINAANGSFSVPGAAAERLPGGLGVIWWV